MESEAGMGICGECNITGPLALIEKHFLAEHVDHKENELELTTTTTTDELPKDEEEKMWSKEGTLLLIRLVESKYEDFNKGIKKFVWIKIATELSQIINKKVTYEQCDSKWKGLKKTYKKIKEENNKTGNNPTKWEYFYTMDSFMSSKPEVVPAAVCSSSEGLKINAEEDQPSSSNVCRKRKAGHSMGIEKRHKEKMEKYDQFLKLFQISVEHATGKKIDQ